MIHVREVAPVEAITKCKVCGDEAVLYGVADFNKSCEESRGRYLPLIGVPVYYHACGSCRLVFTEALDQWTKADYLEHVYNDRYVDVDPDYVEARPRENARIVARFLKSNPRTTHIDYGGGNGVLSSSLNAAGFASSTWDPMDESADDPTGPYGLVTAFEVFEHTPLPHETLREMVALCDATFPLIFFSTFTIDRLPPRSMDFWYLAPRNGHITVHTEASLQALCRRAELSVHHFGNGWHLAYRTLPEWIDLTLFDPPLAARGTWRKVAIAAGLGYQGPLRRWLRAVNG